MLEAEWQENSSTRQLLHGDLGSIPLLRLVLLSEANAAGANGSFHAIRHPGRASTLSMSTYSLHLGLRRKFAICRLQTRQPIGNSVFGVTDC
jgi:ribosomal protein S14